MEETSVSVQPLLQRPASSGSINISLCALGSGTGKPPPSGTRNPAAPGTAGAELPAGRRSLSSSPHPRPGAPGGAAGERQRSLRWSPCGAARGLRSGRGRDGLEMGLVAKNYECVSVCVCV